MRRADVVEVVSLTVLLALGLAAVPLLSGTWGWSWDALNHHVYLGLIAEQPRWHLDVSPASVQSWQYPYLYWPVYRLSQSSIPGAWAGAIWSAGLVVLLMPPLWLTARKLLPAQGGRWQGVFERTSACLLGFSGLVVLSSLGTTANDPLAALPLLWAVAIMLSEQTSDRRAALASALWGVSVAFKASNLLAVPMLLVWWWQRPGWPFPLQRGALLAVGSALGFALAYLPWGWQLWQQTGNPFHPLLGAWFARA